jgi:hypothetical protein
VRGGECVWSGERPQVGQPRLDPFRDPRVLDNVLERDLGRGVEIAREQTARPLDLLLDVFEEGIVGLLSLFRLRLLRHGSPPRPALIRAFTLPVTLTRVIGSRSSAGFVDLSVPPALHSGGR